MANTLDVKKIEQLIDERKKEQADKQIALGESAGVTTAADNELHELVNALNSHDRNSKVVNKMKVVEHRSKNIDPKTGTNMNAPLDENTIKHITTSTPKTQKTPAIHESVQGGGGHMKNDLASQDRGDAMFNTFKSNAGGGSMYDVKNMYNQSGIINEYNSGMATNAGVNNAATMPMGGINPQIISEQIGQHTVNFINEHFVNLADKALKNHIIETYSIDRVKKVLVEEMQPVLKEMVVDIIRDIQNKNKKKSTK